MEAYRQIWEEATATDMKLGGAESVWVWTGITVSVRALVRGTDQFLSHPPGFSL